MKKKILFITSTRIGDAVLSNGVLGYLLDLYPGAGVTVACGPLVESLYQAVPGLDRIIVLRKKTWKRHWIGLWREVIGTDWDIVVDLRNSAVSRLVLGREKFILGGEKSDKIHKSLQLARVLKLDKAPPPRVWFTESQIRKAADIIPAGGPVLGICPTSNWIGKTWPVGNFIELVRRLTAQGQVFDGWRVAVFGAPGEEEAARRLLETIPADRRIDVIAKGTPGDAVACLARCSFYIGNDSGLMHSAAATGIPTLGLFGPGKPAVYAPYGPRAAYVRTPETLEELTSFEGYHIKTLDHSLMTTLTVDAVEEAVRGLCTREGIIPVVRSEDPLRLQG